MDACLSLDTNVLAIIRTGGGKTLAWELPATMQDMVTAVVVPWKTLLQQHLESAREKNIISSQWTAKGKFSEDSKLLFLACESIDCASWARYVSELAINCLID